MQKSDIVQFSGVSISEGIAIGKLIFLKEKKELLSPKTKIKTTDVEKEIQRYRKALSSSRLDLEQIQLGLAKEGSIEAVTIIDTHIKMLEDPLITTLVEDNIRKMLMNTESVFQSVISEYEKQFSKIQDAFFMQRLVDVQDLSQRILNHLHFGHQLDLKKLQEESIIFAKEFCPSHVAEAPMNLVAGLIASYGSETAHSGLIARAKGLPFLIQIQHQDLLPYEGQMAILDAQKQCLILQPDEETLSFYKKKKEEEKILLESCISEVPKHAVTKDGVSIQVLANLDSLHDIDLMEKFHVDGVGLFRSEFLFLEGENANLREDTQFKIYSKLAKKVDGSYFVFRVFDFGGDKNFLNNQGHALNPALGLRSIRFLLKYKDIFRTQLRALFRAFNNKKLNLLIPFIADTEEIMESKYIIQSILEELKDQISIDLKIGAMIEMPSAVILSHQIIEHVDFLSIGTNDLIQYTLVADRQSADMQVNYKSTHPSIIIMLKMCADIANKKNKSVCICGEMASNPMLSMLFIGLGFAKLSCSLRYIPKVKAIIEKIDSAEAKILVDKVLELSTATEIHRLLADEYLQLQYRS